jgi:hypothetical protein
LKRGYVEVIPVARFAPGSTPIFSTRKRVLKGETEKGLKRGIR